MFQVIVIEKDRKPNMIEFDLKSDSDRYILDRLDDFIKCRFKPIVRTNKDALGTTYIRIFQSAELNRKEYPRKKGA